MARGKTEVITDDNYFEYVIPIAKDTINYIVKALRNDCYVATFTPKPKTNELALNTMSISFFFDVDYNRLYVNYVLDKDRFIAVRYSDRQIYNHIYDHLKMIQKDYDIKLSIIGEPTRIPENSRGLANYLVDQEANVIRVSTRSIWDITPAPKGKVTSYFIENKNLLNDDIRKYNISRDLQMDFCKDVDALNREYMHEPHPDLHEVFDRYNNIYNHYFDKQLKSVEDWKTFTLFLDVRHDFEKEKIDDPLCHDNGKFVKTERIDEYLENWRKSHEEPDE